MARPRKESGFTLVHSEGDDYYENRAALEGALKSANKAARVFAGKAIPWQAATETVVTIGVPATRKGKQQPVKASDLPKGTKLNKDGTERKKRGPNKVKPAAVPANGDHKEAAKDGAQP